MSDFRMVQKEEAENIMHRPWSGQTRVGVRPVTVVDGPMLPDLDILSLHLACTATR